MLYSFESRRGHMRGSGRFRLAPRSASGAERAACYACAYDANTCGDCKRRREDHGEHVCRLFGRFECRCGSAWTSAYVWRYSERAHPYCEKQGCRKCGAESEPVFWRPRAKEGGLGSNINGAHDASLCGRCQKLGYNCSGFFRR